MFCVQIGEGTKAIGIGCISVGNGVVTRGVWQVAVGAEIKESCFGTSVKDLDALVEGIKDLILTYKAFGEQGFAPESFVKKAVPVLEYVIGLILDYKKKLEAAVQPQTVPSDVPKVDVSTQTITPVEIPKEKVEILEDADEVVTDNVIEIVTTSDLQEVPVKKPRTKSIKDKGKVTRRRR